MSLPPLLDTPHMRASRVRVLAAGLPQVYPEASADDPTIIHDYTIGSRWLNRELYKAHPSKHAQLYRDRLNAALSQMPVYERVVRHYDARPRHHVGALELREGEEVEWLGFMSCTKLDAPPPPPYQYAHRRVRWVVASRRGRDVEQVSYYGPRFDKPNQREVLFAAGTVFRCLGSNEESDRLTLYLEEL